MKRWLWFSLLVAVSAAAAGQMTLSGKWSATINLLPTISLDTALTLQGDVAGWKVGGTAEHFGAAGYVWQTFDIGGMFGPAEVKWTMLFGPLAPAFLYTLGTTKLAIGGMEFTLYSAYVGPNVPGYVFTGGPSGGMVGVAKADIGGATVSAAVGFGARLTDFTITGPGGRTKTYPVDPFPGGLQFTYLEVTAKGLPFCCGITLDTKFGFTKAGFDSIEFTAKTIPLCCGISFDAVVKFTTTAKTVELVPRWKGIEGCIAVYGDAQFANNVWGGIEIYGFKVRCELAECNYLELLTAFNVAMIEDILDEDIFQGPEFEYLRLGFCGPGCCGGRYTLELTAYFQRMGSLFGLRRLGVRAGIPLMVNFELQLGLGVTVGGPVNLTLGWTFTF